MALGTRLLTYQEFRVRAVAYGYALRTDGHELHLLYRSHCQWHAQYSKES